MKYRCLSLKNSNNALTSQFRSVLTVLDVDQNDEYNWALWTFHWPEQWVYNGALWHHYIVCCGVFEETNIKIWWDLGVVLKLWECLEHQFCNDVIMAGSPMRILQEHPPNQHQKPLNGGPRQGDGSRMKPVAWLLDLPLFASASPHVECQVPFFTQVISPHLLVLCGGKNKSIGMARRHTKPLRYSGGLICLVFQYVTYGVQCIHSWLINFACAIHVVLDSSWQSLISDLIWQVSTPSSSIPPQKDCNCPLTPPNVPGFLAEELGKNK